MPLIQHKFNLIVTILLVQLVLSITGGIMVTSLPKDNKIIRGIYINNIPIGGLTKEEAIKTVTRRFQSINESKLLQLQYKDKKWDLSYSDINAQYDYLKAVNEAYDLGRTGNIFNKVYSVFQSKGKERRLLLNINYSKGKLTYLLKGISDNVKQEAQNARIQMKDDSIDLIPERIGLEVDLKSMLMLIDKAIKEQERVVTLAIRKYSPDVIADDLKDIKDPLSIAVTTFDEQSKNRVDNIILAAQILNGTVVKAGNPFSFNSTVGPRLKEKGYKEAPVFEDGRVVPGIGGGVCQVSTTLYDSILTAGLNVKERYPHSKPVSYVQVGADAAVADGKLDFIFVNNLKNPIGIIATVENNKLMIRIFGKQEKNSQTIKLVSENVQTVEPKVVVKEDSNLNKGYSQVITTGEKGYRAKVYRIWYENGKQSKKELISETVYGAVDTVIRVGTRIVQDIDSPK